MRGKTKTRLSLFLNFLILGIFIMVMIILILWGFMTSLKSTGEISRFPPTIFPVAIDIGLCALQGIQPKDMDVQQVQKKLIEFGASVFRDEEKKAKEEDHAKECVREYMKKREKYITREEVKKQYFE